MKTPGVSLNLTIAPVVAFVALLACGAHAGDAMTPSESPFTAEELSAGRAAVRAYLEAESAADRRKSVVRIASLGERAVDSFQDLLGLDERLLPPEVAEVGDVFPLDSLEGAMLVRVPAASSEAPALRPLLVALLPSQLDDGQAMDTLDSLFGDACERSGWVLAAVRPFRLSDEYTFRKDRTRPAFQPWIRGSAELVPYAITYLMRQLPIDPDRVHVVGFGDGGDGALWAGARYTDRLASVVAVDGTLSERHPTRWASNLSMVPVMLVHGLQDRPEISNSAALARLLEGSGVDVTQMSVSDLASYELEQEEAGTAEAFPVEQLLSWLGQHRRGMLDRTLHWFTDRPGYGAYQWLDIQACGSRTTVRFEAVRARIETTTTQPNRIILNHEAGLQAFSLWIDPDLFDPSSPLIVEQDGRRLFEGEVQARSVEAAVETLLECWQRTGDASRLYSRRLSFDLR